MTSPADELAHDIAKLEAVRSLLGDALVDAQIATLRAARLAPPVPTPPGDHGAVQQSGGTQQGPAVGVNSGTITVFFGASTDRTAAEQQTHLQGYLDALIADCQRLKLQRLSERRSSVGEERRLPAMTLAAVYTTLITDGPARPAARARRRSVAQAKRLADRLARRDRSLATCAPEAVRGLAVTPVAAQGRMAGAEAAHSDWRQLPNETLVTLSWLRPEGVIEAVHDLRHLVLLGDPGGGKSTALRYLAMSLARRALDETVVLLAHPPVPILCPLGRVAQVLHDCGNNADVALAQVLGDILEGEQGLRPGLRAHLMAALGRGGVVLLCDGLDELPVVGGDGTSSPTGHGGGGAAPAGCAGDRGSYRRDQPHAALSGRR